MIIRVLFSKMNKKIFTILVVFCVVVLVAFGGYVFYFSQSNDFSKTPEIEKSEQIEVEQEKINEKVASSDTKKIAEALTAPVMEGKDEIGEDILVYAPSKAPLGVNFEVIFPGMIFYPRETFSSVDGSLSKVEFIIPEVEYKQANFNDDGEPNDESIKKASNVVFYTIYIVDGKLFKQKYIDPITPGSEIEKLVKSERGEGSPEGCHVYLFGDFRCNDFNESSIETLSGEKIYKIDTNKVVGTMTYFNYDLSFVSKNNVGILLDGPHMTIPMGWHDIRPVDPDVDSISLENIKFND